MTKHCNRLALVLTCVLAGELSAAGPQLNRILPRGAQRGSELQVTFFGQRLSDAQEVLIYEPGLTVSKIEQPAEKGAVGKQVRVTLKVAPEARIGEYGLRLRTASGISEFRTFWVGAYPVVQEKEPNSDFKTPQPVPMNVTVAGIIENEDQDFFVVEAKKGERITAEVEGMRLGGGMFDPYVAILDENRFELAACDDSALLRQDPVVSITAPREGKYIIQVRDSAFGGSGNSDYRLHVGNFPRPLVVYPLGGQAGSSVSVQFLGDPAGPMARNLRLPEKADDDYRIFCEDKGLLSPSGNHFRVSDMPNVMEVEPNDSIKTATAYNGPLPVAFNGILSPGSSSESGATAGPVSDHFRFAAKKGQVLEINVYARRLRSPLDSILTIFDEKGRQLANNDDNGGPDSYLRFTPPADGNYILRIRDHLKTAGPMHAYRVEIAPIKPAVAFAIPQYTQQYSQERQAVTVHRGNRYATLIRMTRQDVGGPVALQIPDLPPGIKMTPVTFEPGVDALPVLFEAAGDAPIGGKLVEVKGKHTDSDKADFESGFRQTVELVHSAPNNTCYYQTLAEKMAVASAEEAPFNLEMVAPKVPLVQGGQMSVKIIAKRKADFNGPITLRFLFRPPGVEAAATIDIPAGQNEAIYPVNASDGAMVKTWNMVVVGSDGGGQHWASTQLAKLEIAPPLVTGKIANSSVEQGQSGKITADLDIKTPWEGAAKVELVGLPAGVTAAPREVTAQDKKLEFPITTQKNAPAAAHGGLFLRVTVTRNGEPIVHNIARGGTLRVNLPPGAKKTEAPKPAEKAAGKPQPEKKSAGSKQ